MWASASSDMFSINITKTTKQHRKQSRANKMSKGGRRSQSKVVRESAEMWGMAGRKEDRVHDVQKQGLTDILVC